jgi:hypothetical protein
VIKTGYRRALHQDLIPPPSPPFLPSSLAAKKLSISSFPAAFLTETDPHSEIAVTHSKQTTAPFLTETRIGHFGSRMPSRDARNSAFLTGSGSQTECNVTYSKQTTGTFLTGATTAYKPSAFRNPFPPGFRPRIPKKFNARSQAAALPPPRSGLETEDLLPYGLAQRQYRNHESPAIKGF